MAVPMRPPEVPTVAHKGGRTVAGALIGAIPGIALMIGNVVFTSGEALLSVGIGAIFLAVGGAIGGGMIAGKRNSGA